MQTPKRIRPGGMKMFSAMRQDGYRWFWFSGLGMTASQGVQQLAVAWLVLDLTDSVGQLGLVIFAQGVPMAIVSFYGGVLADRYDRRRLLVGAQFITMLNLFALALLASSGLIHVWHIYVSSVGLGVMQAITMPARTAMIRSLVDDEDMTNGVALNAVQMHSSRILWPSVAGILIALAGIGPTLLLSALCSFAGILCLLTIRYLNAEPARPPSQSSPFQQMLEGLRYVQRTPQVSTVMKLSLCCGLFGLAYMNLSPAFAREELDLNSSGAGLFIMSMGVGAIIGSVAMLVFPVRDAHRLFILLTGVFGLNLVLQAANPWLPGAFVLMAFFGLSNSALVVAGQTFLQVSVPQAFLGRVIGLWSLAGGLGFITSLPLGMLGDAVGLRWSLGGAGLLLLASVLWFGVLAPAPRHTQVLLKETPSIGSGG
jgi:MFS family permease